VPEPARPSPGPDCGQPLPAGLAERSQLPDKTGAIRCSCAIRRS